MEINGINNINFPEDDHSKKTEQRERAPQQVQTEASSADALAAQGRAFVNMYSNAAKNYTTRINPELKELTDAEFEEYKKEIKSKIENLPKHTGIYTKDWSLDKNNIFVADKILSEEKLFNNFNFMNLSILLFRNESSLEISKNRIKLLDKITKSDKLSSNKFFMKQVASLVENTKTNEQLQIADIFFDKILSDEKYYNNNILMKKLCVFIRCTTSQEQAETIFQFIDKISENETISGNDKLKDYAFSLLKFSNSSESVELLDAILSNEQIYGNEAAMKFANKIVPYAKTSLQTNAVNRILNNEHIYNNPIYIDENIVEIIEGIDSDEKLQIKMDLFDKCSNSTNHIPQGGIPIIKATDTAEQMLLANKIISNKQLSETPYIHRILENINSKEDAQIKIDVIDKIFSEEKLYNDENFVNIIPEILEYVLPENEKTANGIISMLLNNEMTVEQASTIINEADVSLRDIQKLNKFIGLKKASELSRNETIIAAKFINTYKKNNINEIPIQEKRDFLRKLVSSNEELFSISDEMKNFFPILPTSQEEYCSLLPSIVCSLGIETNTLNDKQVENFNTDINNLSLSLEKIPDEEFNNLDIKQEYDKDTFIKDVLSAVKDLPTNERQKVYDYFGFELYQNKMTKTGFSISGYPVNLNNGHKLAQITDENTKKVVEELRPLVVKFSENNPITCSNKEIETNLNNIFDVLPELRTLIGKVQAGNIDENGNTVGNGSHDFDVFKHSLKVMQKITQNPQFNRLNESDKRIMLLASLLHDITKKEGYTDPYHADIGSFDTFFISKKFNFSQEEKIKLYNLIKHHEWLGYVNRSGNEDELTKRLQSVAYDLRHDNMLDMSLIFTHADLKAVKQDDSFHDKTDGKGRKDFNGNIRSFGESADFYANKIKTLIEELKHSQPLLPVTKLPSASIIEKAINHVNENGSTNIKGVYKDKDGLVIIKYNELENEDLEKIGFPKGSLVSGIKSTTDNGDNVDTGNIKFFVHGLDYSNQLAKFDAFSLVDSDALLSVSYAERPESKFRFFRPQGIILDCDTKYVHGGGNTDAGSGCGKNIQEFKNNYIFGGIRESDRKYISNLIKKSTGMNDEEYIDFVKENENKSLNEIQPEEVRIKIINAFATINSNIRKGNRSYNEMYISNPKPPMAVFAYNLDYNENIENPVDFLNRTSVGEHEKGYNGVGDINVVDRTSFLRKYALEHNLPFIVFGN